MSTLIPHMPHVADELAEDGAEARMRQALGQMGTARMGQPEAVRRKTYQATAGAGRHRFRQDSEVPGVRICLAEGGRGGERQLRAPAEVAQVQAGAGQGHMPGARIQDDGETARQVRVLTEQLQATQTRLGHAELVAAEASRTAQARQEEAAGLRQALSTAEAALAQVRAELAASERAREVLVRRQDATHPGSPRANERDDTAVRRQVGRPLGSTRLVRDQGPAGEAAPVKWWAGD